MGTDKIFVALHQHQVSGVLGRADHSPHGASSTSDFCSLFFQLPQLQEERPAAPGGSAWLGHRGSVCSHRAWLHPKVSSCTRNSAKPGSGASQSSPLPQCRDSSATHPRTRAGESYSSPSPGWLSPVGSGLPSSAWIAMF